MSKKNIAFVISSPSTAKAFLLNHFELLSKSYNITLIANFFDVKDDLRPDLFNVQLLVDIPIERKISPINDLKSIFKLWRFFATNDYYAVHSITPKAGLVAMVASCFARIKHRTHTFTGQVWVTKKGLSRFILKTLDKLTYKLSTYCLVDSFSQQKFLIENNIISLRRSSVLGNGSISGVNYKRFEFNQAAYSSLREKFNISDKTFVFLYLGRLYAEKGVNELLSAFSKLTNTGADVHLLIVGPNEENFNNDFFDNLNFKNLSREGLTNSPESYFSASDVFVLPSYREGFGTVILEAAAAGIPSIGSDIYGLSDAIENGVTGLLHDAKDEEDLYQKMLYLYENKKRASEMGVAALNRVKKDFSSELISEKLVAYYDLKN